ncbi:hypothetical protein ACRRTK_006821 [Alexandromys fortis]
MYVSNANCTPKLAGSYRQTQPPNAQAYPVPTLLVEGTVSFQLTGLHLAKHYRLPVQGCIQPFPREHSAFPIYQQLTLSISET